MSEVKIRRALTDALKAMASHPLTQWENAPKIEPVDGSPYQEVVFLFAEPDNNEMGSAHVEYGLMQVTLCYPANKGTATAITRFEAIRSTFYRGQSFTYSGVKVTVWKTPSHLTPFIENGRYCVPVRVPFFSHITT